MAVAQGAVAHAALIRTGGLELHYRVSVLSQSTRLFIVSSSIVSPYAHLSFAAVAAAAATTLTAAAAAAAHTRRFIPSRAALRFCAEAGAQPGGAPEGTELQVSHLGEFTRMISMNDGAAGVISARGTYDLGVRFAKRGVCAFRQEQMFVSPRSCVPLAYAVCKPSRAGVGGAL